MWKNVMTIQYTALGLELRPSEHESPPITTRPGLILCGLGYTKMSFQCLSSYKSSREVVYFLLHYSMISVMTSPLVISFFASLLEIIWK